MQQQFSLLLHFLILSEIGAGKNRRRYSSDHIAAEVFSGSNEIHKEKECLSWKEWQKQQQQQLWRY